MPSILKKISAITALFAMTYLYCGATVPVEVRKNTEFFSTVARTAGAKEYVNNSYKDYTARIDSATAPYRNHPAIEYFKTIRSRHGFSYDAVALFGLALDIKDGKVMFNPSFDYEAMLDRITKEEADSLLPYLDDFYRLIDFDRIYSESKPLYNKAIDAFNHMQQNIDYDWLAHFYGIEYNAITAGLSMLNTGNYGSTEKLRNGEKRTFMLIGTQSRKGIPDYSGCESLIIHEGSHPVTNPLIDNTRHLFNSNSDTIAARFAAQLSAQAYESGLTVLYETMVRTAEARYAYDHATTMEDSIKAKIHVISDKTSGFLFIEDFVNALDTYEANRDKYPTLADFMPELAKLHNSLDVDSITGVIKDLQPNFIGCNISDNQIVKPGYTEITIRFDKPIFIGHGIGNMPGREYPASEDSKVSWNPERTEFTYSVTLKPSTKYGVSFYGTWFYTKDGYPVTGAYMLPFETSE